MLSICRSYIERQYGSEFRALYDLAGVVLKPQRDTVSTAAVVKQLLYIPLCDVTEDIDVSELSKRELQAAYRTYSSPCEPPERVIRMGSKLVINLSNVPPFGCKMTENLPREIHMLFACLEEYSASNSSLSASVKQIIVLCENPRDFIGDPSLDIAVIDQTSNGNNNHENEAASDENLKPAMRGKYELLHGAVYGGPAPQFEADYVFGKIVQLAQKARDHRRLYKEVGNSAPFDVSFVSCGWTDGCDFQVLDDGGLLLSHFSLLEFNSQAPSKSQSDLYSRACTEADIVASLPSSLRLSVIQDSFPDRIMVVKKRGIFFEHHIRSEKEEVDDSINIGSPLLKISSIRAKDSISVDRGPYVADIGSNHAVIGVCATGFGMITCRLFSVPMSLTYEDMMSVPAEDYEYLKLLGSVKKRVTGRGKILFLFKDLDEFSSYCVIVEPSQEIQKLAVFKTLPSSQAPMHSIILAAVPRSGLHPSKQCLKICQLLDAAAYSSYTIHLSEFDNDSVAADSDVLAASQDVLRLERQSRVSVTRDECYYQDTKVDVLIRGNSAILTPRNTSSESCLSGVLESFQRVTAFNPKVVTILIVCPNPLVRYLHRSRDGLSWASDQCFAIQHKEQTATLLRALLEWKCDATGRDVTYFSVMDVNECKIAYIEPMVKSSRYTCIRNIMLPRAIVAKRAIAQFKFFDGVQSIGDMFRYKLVSCNKADSSFTLIHPKVEVYGKRMLPGGESMIYCVDVTNDSDYVFGTEDGATYHGVLVRTLVHDADYLRLMLGPVIGLVTQTSAAILIETNLDLPNCRCRVVCPSLRDEEGEVVELSLDLKANVPARYDFENLVPDSRYFIVLPDLCGEVYKGSFRTQQPIYKYTQVAFVGENAVPTNFPVIQKFFKYVNDGQVTNLSHIDSEFIFMDMHKRSSANSAKSSEYKDSMVSWNWAAKYLNDIRSQTTATFHLGSHSVISKMFGKIVSHIITIVKRILSCANIDLSEYSKEAFIDRFREMASKSIILHLFQKDIDSILKQAFRTLYGVPELGSFLASGSQILLFHSMYHTLFDSSSASKVNLSEKYNMESAMYLCDLLRRNSQIYILSLREQMALKDQLYQDFDSHFYHWRQGDLAVVSLDLAFGRIPGYEESKKGPALRSEESEGNADEGEDEGEDGGENEEDKKAPKASQPTSAPSVQDSYSPGFFNRSQWLKLKSIFEDASVNQLVITTQWPLVGLQAIPRESTVKNKSLHSAFSVPFEWEPTADDLNVFLQLIVKWLDPKRGFGVVRTAVLLSSSPVPYSTSIMDIKTGQIIHQVCVPQMTPSTTLDSNSIENIRSTATMSGKIKSVQYFHRFTGLDMCTLDSTRIGAPRTASIYGVNDSSNYGSAFGFGLLRVWFDSWKAQGSLSLCRHDRANHPSGPAVLTVGPVIGVPSYMKTASGESSKIEVPILIEVDRVTDITIELIECFTGVSKIVIFGAVQPRVPKIILLGNLNAETRYNCYFRGGILNPAEHFFVIQTSLNVDETNVAILNMEIDPEQAYCSDFMLDLCRRTAVPFNGINLVVHTNVSITFEEILREVEGRNGVKTFIDGLRDVSIDGLQKIDIPPIVKDEIHNLLDRIREEFRVFFTRPSYRELLRSTFNMFLPAFNACEVHFSRPEGYGGFLYFFDLLIERVRQEYFDQLFVPRENPFRAVPHFPHPKENSKVEYAYDRIITTIAKEEVAADAKAAAAGEGGNASAPAKTVSTADALLESYFAIDQKKRREAAGKERDPNVDDVSEKEILRMKRTVFPAPIETPRNMDAAEAVFAQWKSNLIEPTVIIQRIAWLSLNKKLSIECMAPPRRDYLREDYECYISGELDTGVRLIIMHGDSVIRLYESGGVLDVSEKGKGVCGRRIQGWLAKWANGAKNRKACIVCPSSRDGNTSVPLVPPEPKSTKGNTSVPDPPDTMELFLIGSIHLSTQKDIKDLRRALALKLKADMPKLQGGNSRAAVKARDDQKKAMLDAQARELQEKFSLYLPDGYIIVESKCGVGFQNATIPPSTDAGTEGQQPYSTAEIECRIWVRRITSLLGGEEEERALIEKADGSRPGLSDFIQLPSWFLRFLPGKHKVFVQDEVLMMARQEPTARKFLEMLEENSGLREAAAEVYKKSRLSEFSRKEDKREVDMSLPGTVEVLFREVMDHIWEKIVPDEAKSHMANLCDDFVRSLCMSYALQGKSMTSVFSSANNFGTAVHRSFILALQLFMAHKLSKIARYKRILDLPEFVPPGEDSDVDDDDEDFMSEDGDPSGNPKAEDDDIEEFDDDGNLIVKQKPIAASAQPQPAPAAVAASNSTVDSTGAPMPPKEDPFLVQKRLRTVVRRFWGEKATFLSVQQPATTAPAS